MIDYPRHRRGGILPPVVLPGILLLYAIMIELINEGVPNIICAQPFACLPNHVTGKGMIRKLRELYPKSNIVPIDYDPGASEINQLNRIKLMISGALREQI